MGMLSAPAAMAAAPESTDPIRIPINEWTGQHITAQITGELLKKMGYNVEYVTAGAVPQFAAIAQGNLDLQPEVWDNNVGDIYPKAIADGDIVQVGELGLQPREGWMYPPYMDEKCPGLPDWKAFVNCAQAFGTAETFPKGRLIDYPADWGTRSKDLIEASGIPFQAIAGGSEGAMVAELKFNWIELPPADANCGTDASLGMSPDKLNDCGFAQAHIGKIVWKGFKDKWPAAYKLVEAIKIDNETQNKMMLEIDNKGGKLEDVVAQWLKDNEATWKPWIDGANS